MGSATWSDTSINNPATLSDEQKKEITVYCNQPDNMDLTWDIIAKHFTDKFGQTVTSDQVFALVVG